MERLVLRSADWLAEARAEFKAARDLLNTDNFAWSCFTSQQAAEKALKGVLDELRLPAFGENLNQLIEYISPHVALPDSLREAARRLNRHYIPTRYPDAFVSGIPAAQYGRADAEESIANAEAVIDFAARIIGSA